MSKIIFISKRKPIVAHVVKREFEYIYGINLEELESFSLSDNSGLLVVSENGEFVITESEAIEEFMGVIGTQSIDKRVS